MAFGISPRRAQSLVWLRVYRRALAKVLPEAVPLSSVHAIASVAGASVAMSNRAARRLCDRLVTLGAARTLTGRSTVRLYGL